MEQRKPKRKSLALWSAGLAAVVSGGAALSTMLGGPGLDQVGQDEIVGHGQRLLLAIDELIITGLAIGAYWGRLRARERLR